MGNYFELTRRFIEISGNLYEIIRTMREDPEINIEAWKQALRVDTVFRKDGEYYFVRLVEEAQIIPEANADEQQSLPSSSAEGSEEDGGDTERSN